VWKGRPTGYAAKYAVWKRSWSCHSVRIMDGHGDRMHSSPAHAPSSSLPFSSTITGSTPKKGSDAQPDAFRETPGPFLYKSFTTLALLFPPKLSSHTQSGVFFECVSPGFCSNAKGSGVMTCEPVSVCQYVSTMGHAPLPMSSWYLQWQMRETKRETQT
jgi:hypothetical protein